MPISPAQQEFRNLNTWLRGYTGGRGAGKTRIGTVDIMRRAKPKDRWLAVSPDNNMIRETTLPTFEEVGEFTGQLLDIVTSPIPKATFRTRWGGTAQIVFRGAEKPDKLRGGNYSGIWFDEASIIVEAAFNYGIATCRRGGKMGPCLATFTPQGFKHWTFQKFFQRIKDDEIAQHGDAVRMFQGRPYLKMPRTGLVHCRTRDNPFLPEEFEATIGGNYSTMLAAQELDGEFIEITGMIFRREWFHHIEADKVPINANRVRYWDKAATADGGCYTVGLLMARDNRGRCYVEDVIRGQWSYHDRNKIMLQTAQRDFLRYGGTVLTYIEQEGGGDAKVVMDQLIVMLGAYPVYRDIVGGNAWKNKGNIRLPGDAKVRRALPFAAQAEAGNVYVVDAAWTTDYLEELCMFPEFAFADQVDGSSGAFNKLAGTVPDGLVSQIETYDANVSHYGETLNLSKPSTSRWKDLPWNQATELTDDQTEY